MNWRGNFGIRIFLFAIVVGAFLTQQTVVQGCPPIVSRAQWGAKAPTLRMSKLNTPVPRIFIHHTATGQCYNTPSCSAIARNVQNMHIKLGWGDIGYNFLIGGDGKAYEGRGFNTLGIHSNNYNRESIAISFIGNFETTQPSQVMLNAAKSLMSCAVSKKSVRPNYYLHGHRNAVCTACPGIRLYNIIKTWPGFNPGKNERLPLWVC